MKIFISWSGDRGKAVAMALRDWLPNVLQGVGVFCSVSDIEKGSDWMSKISSELEDTRFGIVVVTPESKDSRWLLFEAGALVKGSETSRVTPLLIGMKMADLETPLSTLNAAVFDEEEMVRILSPIDSSRDSSVALGSRLAHVVNKWWSDLESSVAVATQIPVTVELPASRSEAEVDDEMLTLLRDLTRQVTDLRSVVVQGDVGRWTLSSSGTSGSYFGPRDEPRTIHGTDVDKDRDTASNFEFATALGIPPALIWTWSRTPDGYTIDLTNIATEPDADFIVDRIRTTDPSTVAWRTLRMGDSGRLRVYVTREPSQKP